MPHEDYSFRVSQSLRRREFVRLSERFQFPIDELSKYVESV
jgi:hypothetical protein